MYIYSEKTNKKYDSVEACVEAEKAFELEVNKIYEKIKAYFEEAEKERLASERAARAKEVEEAYQKIVDARKEYDAVLDKFVEDYGSFHMSIHRSSNGIISIYKDLKVIVIDQGFDSAIEINFDADGKII